MTMRTLLAGYTAYTDAEELTATRGTHRNILVTSTDTSTTFCLDAPSSGLVAPGKAAVLTIVRQVQEQGL